MKAGQVAMRSSKCSMCLFLLCVAATLCACGASASPLDWSTLPPVSDRDAFDSLEPVWDNRVTDSRLDIRLYVEPYCRTDECKGYIQQTVLYFTALTDARVRIYDYPLSQEAKSFLFSGIGRCIAQKTASGYLDYLRRALTLPDAYDNNVQMQALSKAVIGEYDTRCINNQIKEIKARFENANPLNLERIPATLVNGRIVYGNLSQKQAAALVASVPR